MTNNEEHVSLRNDSPHILNYFAEPASIIAFITACLYFVGFGYYSSYLSRFSIPMRFINIDTIEYVRVGFSPIIFLGVFIAMFFMTWSNAPKNRLEAFSGNLLMFIFLFIYIVTDPNRKFIDNVILLVLILFLIFLSYHKYSMAYFFYKKGFAFKIGLIFIILLGLFNISVFWGDITANELIHGQRDRLEIQLFLKDKMNIELQNKNFILVMLHDNKYYISEINETASEYPKLYIIPTDEVEMAEVYTVIKHF